MNRRTGVAALVLIAVAIAVGGHSNGSGSDLSATRAAAALPADTAAATHHRGPAATPPATRAQHRHHPAMTATSSRRPRRIATANYPDRTRTGRPTRPKAHLGTIHPGGFCAPSGANGLYNGRVYTCKGPGQSRWRR